VTPLSLDHIVIAVRDLEAARASYQRLLGRAPSWRGRHPAYGTANVLFRLDNTYVELLAPAGGAPSDSPWLRALRDQLDGAGEGLYAFALGTDKIDAAVACARERGIDALDPADGDGLDESTGARRAWRNARIRPESLRGVRAFFIEHRAGELPPARPAAGRGVVTGVDHLVLGSSDIDASLALWRDGFGLDLRATVDWPPSGGGSRLHFLRLGGPENSAVLELAGEAAPATRGARDALWGVSYRVDDVAATVERLRAAKVTVSEVREGRAPGSRVADLKPGFSHDVRTLFIEREVA
jgi:catechol 2,3-dioxygenase-like lactoylglutathione lyase family enzyme